VYSYPARSWAVGGVPGTEGYVSLQQFKRILSATLPMAEFSGKKEVLNSLSLSLVGVS
jgi:hypothetical protein